MIFWFMFWLTLSYFLVGWVVRTLARLDIVWCFVPAGTVGFVQRKANRKRAVGDSQKATPASGSEIIDVLCGVPGHKIDRHSTHDLMDWEVVLGRETRRRGLMYYLYGVTWLGPFCELRINKIREVRLSINEQKIREAEEKRKKGEDVDIPTYTEDEKDYETVFVYYSREHDVATRGAETAGAFELNVFSKVVYQERFPVRARLKVADSNATLQTLVDKSVIDMTGGEQPEFYLFEDVPGKDARPGTLKSRRDNLRTTVEDEIRQHALPLIGIKVEKFVLYSIEMTAEQRKLLQLQERTKRENDAAIAIAEKDLVVKKKANEGEADHVQKVIMPAAQSELTVRVREAEAYEKNEVVTTFAPGAGIMVGTK